MLLHELATGAADLGAYRFVAVGKTVDLHKSLLSIVEKKSFLVCVACTSVAAMRQQIWLHMHCYRRQ